ncbi:HhH-GPD family base excision DNA repair protein [Cladophialophora carrionii]|uniref:HhH-GPD family base excision DNA repair protein n=1 Tax=Cladophialophora carrionii TaxID=86049 RepID=A0A1C1CI59_9EURO|nr:HhH-GPD family base excision DNA repair protein [Cladophialophora carrionii]
MSRATRVASATQRATRSSTSTRAGAAAVKKQQPEEAAIKQEQQTPEKASRAQAKRALSAIEKETPKRKRVKKEEEEDSPLQSASPSSSYPSKKSPSSTRSTPSTLKDKKLKSYAQFANVSPFPDFLHPTPEECKLAHRILSSLHGPRTRPTQLIASTDRAGCGDSPSVLDALVRTILSQNTSDVNSSRAKKSMDKIYGRSDKWDAIVAGGQAKLQDAIKCGGLSAVKSKVILSILNQVYEKYGLYSLDHLHQASSEDAMAEMLSFHGVGPKTASCVLLFCLQRESFAVDTHVWRITGLLGWRPKTATRDETHAHLDVMIPDEDKYGLHILLVTHGKKCDECKAGGKNLGKCELRKAFRQKKMEGEAGEDVKQEEIELVKQEHIGTGPWPA